MRYPEYKEVTRGYNIKTNFGNAKLRVYGPKFYTVPGTMYECLGVHVLVFKDNEQGYEDWLYSEMLFGKEEYKLDVMNRMGNMGAYTCVPPSIKKIEQAVNRAKDTNNHSLR